MIHRTRTGSDAFSVDFLRSSLFYSSFSFLVVLFVEEETPETREPEKAEPSWSERDHESGMCFCECVCMCVYSVILKVERVRKGVRI